MFKGSGVAIVTPFNKGKIDLKKYGELIEFQIKNKTDAIFPCGCTGEAATLSHKEQHTLISYCVEVVNKRVPVIAGSGSNCTAEALQLTQAAKKAKADGVLMITPYYNKPTPEGVFRHYSLVAGKVDIPIMLYNVPSRTGLSLSPETIARLSKVDNIVAVKEASGSIDQVSRILELCDILVYCGDDALTLPMMSIGAKGVVSVAANIIPERIHNMTRNFLAGKVEAARKIHADSLKLFKALFIETNPIPVKTALMLMNMLNGELRMPLCEMTENNFKQLKNVLSDYKLIPAAKRL